MRWQVCRSAILPPDRLQQAAERAGLVDLPMPLPHQADDHRRQSSYRQGAQRCFLSQPGVTPSSVVAGVPGHRALSQADSRRGSQPACGAQTVPGQCVQASAANRSGPPRPGACRKEEIDPAGSGDQDGGAHTRQRSDGSRLPLHHGDHIILAADGVSVRLLTARHRQRTAGRRLQAAADATRCFSRLTV